MPAVIQDILSTYLRVDNLSGWQGSFSKAGQSVISLGRNLDDNGGDLAKWSAKALIASSLAGGLSASLVKATENAGRMERLGVAFGQVAGGGAAAAGEMEQLRQTSAAKLFGDETILRTDLRLRNMGMSAAFSSTMIEAVGNATAATGGKSEEFASTLAVLSRAQEEHRVSSRELNQLARLGIPIHEELARKLGITANSVHNLDLEGGAADRALRLLAEALNEKYFNGMTRAMDTADGAMDRFRNTVFRTGVTLGGPFLSAVSTIANAGSSLLDLFDRAPKPIKETASAAGVILVGALGLFGRNAARNAIETAGLAREVLSLGKAHLQAADGARMQAVAEDGLGASLARTRTRTGAAVGSKTDIALMGAFGGRTATGASEETMAMNAIFGREALEGAPAVEKSGFLAKLKGAKGILPFAGLVAGDLALNALPDEGGGGAFKRIGGRAVEGAGLGLLFGPEGALVGGGLGAALGAFEESQRKSSPGGKDDDPQQAIIRELQKVNDNLQRQLDEQRQLYRTGGPFDVNQVPGALQAQVLNRGLGR